MTTVASVGDEQRGRLRRVDIVKLVLSACAACFLAWGIRTDSAAYRWVGIALLVAAVLLRFVPAGRR